MKSWWIWTVVVAACVVESAAGQVYRQTRQSLDIRTATTARVPGQPDAVDSDAHTSDAMGPFNELVVSRATASVPGSQPLVFASGNVEGLGALIPGEDFITGAMAPTYRVDSRGGDAGANSNVSLETEFTVPRDTPFHIESRLVVTFDPAADDGSRDAGGGVFLRDLDTEDPHGGPTTVFGFFAGVDSAWDLPAVRDGTLLAGHRYVLRLEADAGRELLNNPPLPGDHVSYGRSELTFRMDLPEPSGAMALMIAGALLCGRRRTSGNRFEQVPGPDCMRPRCPVPGGDG